ncbi:MAG: hypothetical protein ABL930_00940 [Pseudobdellovibrio sp.]
MKYLVSLLFISTFVWAIEVNQDVELTRYVNARYSANFSKDERNVISQIAKGSKGTVREVRQFSSGNSGFLIEVKDGDLKGQKVWIHYDPKNASLKLTDAQQRPTTDVDQAQQTVATRSVPVTREPVSPRSVLGRADTVVQDLARLNSGAQSGASDCASCTPAASGQSGGLPVSSRALETSLTSSNDVNARIKCSHKSDQGMTHAGSIEVEINNNVVTKLNAKISGCEVNLNTFKQVFFDNKNIVLRHANGCGVVINQNLKVRGSGNPVLNFGMIPTQDCVNICKKVEKGYWQVEMNPHSQNCY